MKKSENCYVNANTEWCVYGLEQLKLAQKHRPPTQDDVDFDFERMDLSQLKRTISAIFPEYEKALEEFLVTQTALAC